MTCCYSSCLTCRSPDIKQSSPTGRVAAPAGAPCRFRHRFRPRLRPSPVRSKSAAAPTVPGCLFPSKLPSKFQSEVPEVKRIAARRQRGHTVQTGRLRSPYRARLSSGAGPASYYLARVLLPTQVDHLLLYRQSEIYACEGDDPERATGSSRSAGRPSWSVRRSPRLPPRRSRRAAAR